MVLVWTLTLKSKIGSPPPSGFCPKIAFFRWNIGTDHDLAVYIIINEKVDDTVLVESFVHWSTFAVW